MKINTTFNKLNKKYNHSLSNILYSYQSVVLLLFIIPLILAWQFSTKLCFAIIGGVLFIVSLITNKLLADAKLNAKNLFFLALLLALVSGFLTPSRLPIGSPDQQAVISGEVINIKGLNIDLKVNVFNNKAIFPPARLRIRSDEVFSIGDKVILETTFQVPNQATNPGQFNYREYLLQKGIYYIGNQPKIIKQTPSFSLKKQLNSLRGHLISPAEKMLPERVFTLFSAMILGEKTGLDKEIYAYYQGAGISHVLVISGMHVGLLAGCIIYVLTKMRVSRKKSIVITLLFIWSYALITGLSISVIRASIMLSIILVAKALYQVHKPLNTLALVAVVMVTVNPLTLVNLSWQLSFAATAGILIILPVINKTFGYSKAVNSVGVIIAVQLATLPIVANTFNFLATYALPANLIIVPLTYATLVFGILFLLPIVGKLLLYPVIILLRANLEVAKFFSSLPFSKISLKQWTLLFTCFYIIVLLVLLILIKLKKRKVVIPLGILILCIGIFNLGIGTNYFEVTFLDVEQGDSAVLIWPNGFTMVIDGGELSEYRDYGSSVLLPFLRQAGISKIDALVVSHSDNDHIGGLLSVAEEVFVSKIYLSPQAYYLGNDTSKKLIESSRKKGTAIEQLVENDMIKIMTNSYIEVYSPVDNIKTSDSNNNSLVLRVVYGATSILFTGDIEEDTEQRITSKYKTLLESDVIKVPHHGSNTSSSTGLLEYVQPQAAVFSAGRNNRFGHPHKEIVERYDKQNISMWRTDKDGAIMLRSNGKEIEIKGYLHNQNK